VSVAPGGIAVVGVGLVQNLEKSRVQLTYLALLFVGAFLAIRLRSVIRSLLSLVPVLVAVGAVSLIAVAFNLKLSPVTSVAGPLVVAVCTEFTSLILLRFVEERNRGLPLRRAMDATARRTGRAFMVSGATAIAGVAVLGTSSMPLLRDFGIIVALNVLVALLSALVVLPPILVWADQRLWVSRGLLRPVPEPYDTPVPEPVVLDGPAHLPQVVAPSEGTTAPARPEAELVPVLAGSGAPDSNGEARPSATGEARPSAKEKGLAGSDAGDDAPSDGDPATSDGGTKRVPDDLWVPHFGPSSD
jgi:hypothetical protein